MTDSCCLECVVLGTRNRTKPMYNVAKEKKETVRPLQSPLSVHMRVLKASHQATPLKDFTLYHTGLWGDFYEPNHSKLILRCSFHLLDLTPAPCQPSSITSRKTVLKTQESSV